MKNRKEPSPIDVGAEFYDMQTNGDKIKAMDQARSLLTPEQEAKGIGLFGVMGRIVMGFLNLFRPQSDQENNQTPTGNH